MKKLLLLLTVLLTVSLTACGEEMVEQRTMTCSDGENEFAIVLIYQEDRIMLLRDEYDTMLREYDYDDIRDAEEYLLAEYDGDDFFDIEEDLEDELEDMGYECNVDEEEVIYIEFDSEDDDDPDTNIGSNTARDAVLADALAIENAAKLYCSQTTCSSDEELTWTQLENYVEGLDETDYDFTNNMGIIATKENGRWTVDLERSGTGDWEFTQDLTPSENDRSAVIEDID